MNALEYLSRLEPRACRAHRRVDTGHVPTLTIPIPSYAIMKIYHRMPWSEVSLAFLPAAPAAELVPQVLLCMSPPVRQILTTVEIRISTHFGQVCAMERKLQWRKPLSRRMAMKPTNNVVTAAICGISGYCTSARPYDVLCCAYDMLFYWNMDACVGWSILTVY